MPSVTISHQPDLTAEEAADVFEDHFGDKYEVYAKGEGKTPWFGPKDVIVKESAWIAIAIGIKQSEDKTSFNFGSVVPALLGTSGLLGFLFLPFAGLILAPARLLLMIPANRLHNEVKEFMENAPEFNGAVSRRLDEQEAGEVGSEGVLDAPEPPPDGSHAYQGAPDTGLCAVCGKGQHDG